MNSLPALSRPRRPSMDSLPALSRPWRPYMMSLPVQYRPRRPFLKPLSALSRPWTLIMNSFCTLLSVMAAVFFFFFFLLSELPFTEPRNAILSFLSRRSIFKSLTFLLRPLWPSIISLCSVSVLLWSLAQPAPRGLQNHWLHGGLLLHHRGLLLCRGGLQTRARSHLF
ncbi:hypothetical protein PO909_030495 [Leuciscus waleckii]